MTNKGLVIALVAVLILGIGAGSYFLVNQGGFGQSVITPPSTVNFDNGKAYWIMTGSANNLEAESYTFRYGIPKAVENNAGEVITPKASISVSVQKQDSYCDYQLINRQKKISISFITIGTINYQTLANPERVAEIKVSTNKGNSVIFDGTVVDQRPLTDPDGKGTITVQSQGLLAGKRDCPNYANVALFENRIVDKDDLENKLDNLVGLSGLTNVIKYLKSEVRDNTAFTSSFREYPFIGADFISGEMDLGNVVFTMTADQDYFDAVTYTPPKEADPEIVSINVANEMKASSTNSLNVVLKNKADNAGLVVVDVGANGASITPSKQNFNLQGTQTLFFTISTENKEGCGNTVNVEVCSVSQFSSTQSCDSKSKSFCITKDQPQTYCGNEVCEATENNATCPQDCYNPKPTECGNDICEVGEGPSICPADCAIADECEAWVKAPDWLGGKTIIPDLWCKLNNALNSFKWVFASILGLLAGALAGSFAFRLAEKRKIKSKWAWIIGAGLLIGFSVLLLAYQFFWWILLVVAILSIIKWIVPGI